jgi:raffinose/stachyose/melibiose transport system permease protein
VIVRRERIATYAVLAVFSIAMVAPVLGLVLVALHGPGDVVSGLGIPSSLHFDNFTHAWSVGHFGTYLRSSVIVSLAVVALSTVLSILSGYAFGTMRFPGANALFYLLLLGLIVPFEATVVPLYYDLRSWGLTNTYWSLILPQVGLSMSFGTFWMRAYFRSVPKALIEAARIDGATSWTVLWRVLMHGARPALTTLVLLLFMWSWNEFLLALVMVSDEGLRTAPLGLAFFVGQHSTDVPGLAAGASLVALPVVVVYIALQRHFIRGMLDGAIKG